MKMGDGSGDERDGECCAELRGKAVVVFMVLMMVVDAKIAQHVL